MNIDYISYDIPKYLLNILGDYWLVILALKIILCIADWKTLEKANERGWKQFIPIYKVYIEYKLYWKTSAFWLSFFSPIIVIVLLAVGYNNIALRAILYIIALVFVIYVSLFAFILQVKKSKSFNQGVIFAFGLIFLNFIFRLILGFDDKCQYSKIN